MISDGESEIIPLIVTSQITKEKRNAIRLMFSAIAESIKYGVSAYRSRMDEMSTVIRRLLKKYGTEEIIAMPYTMEDFRKDVVREALGYMTPDGITEKFPRRSVSKGAFHRRNRSISETTAEKSETEKESLEINVSPCLKA